MESGDNEPSDLRRRIPADDDGAGTAARHPDRPTHTRRECVPRNLSLSNGRVVRGDWLGIQKLVRDFGWTNFRFDWIIDRDLAICTVIIAGVWQATGFAMVLFLAGIRSVNADLLRAAQIDGAGPWRTYRRVVLPSMTPIVLSVLVILLQFAIKTFDLVLALTSGGPGLASTLPTLVIYDFLFQRGLMARGSAAAILLLLSVVVVVGPYLAYVQWRRYRELSNA
jgi:glucose/mannose transport system permease protein